MKHFTRARLAAQIGLVVATAGGAALASPPPGMGPQMTPGTGQQSPTQCESATDTSQDATPDATANDPYGPMKIVADALSKVCLSDDQRAAVEKLGNEVAPKEKAVADARHAFLKDLEEQFRSGNIDDGALKSDIDALVHAREDASPVLRKALEDLHGILDPGQRAAFVDALQGRMKDIQQASGGWLGSLDQDLNLNDQQKQRLQDVMNTVKPQVDKERGGAEAAFDAFKGDQFSIEQIAPESQIGPRTRASAEGMVKLAKEIADILTPEQRGKLADEMEAKASAAGAGSDSARMQDEQPGQVQQGIVARGFRAGAVRGWGRGFRGGWGRGVRTAYVGGYPFVGGFTTGIW